MILAAVGTGKHPHACTPYVEQLLRWSASDQKRRLGGLILEVKGDFCGQVQSILRRRQREADYVESGFDNGVLLQPTAQQARSPMPSPTR
jgi:hypothetical protein